MSKYCKVLGFVPCPEQTVLAGISCFCVTESEWLDLSGPQFPPGYNHPPVHRAGW